MDINYNLRKSFRIIGGGIVFVGLIPLILGIYGVVKTNKFLFIAIEGEAEVIELEEKTNHKSKSGVSYRPKIKFIDKAGIQQVVTSNTSSYPAPYRIGEVINIYYDPLTPQNFRINNFFELWTLEIFGFLCFLGFLFMGLVFMFLGPIILQTLFQGLKEVRE
tara:strand:- start:467 stop:952 length:486 start_codon:yes stop_codon:yes gene_type:complete